MSNCSILSQRSQKNWWTDALLFISALLASLSGIYFLYFPVGGFQGGRNPYHDILILFERGTWDDLHTWGGIAMILVAIVHLVIHWSWVVNTLRWLLKVVSGRTNFTSRGGFWNLILNTILALSFLLTAISGVYFLFFPAGRGIVDPLILFSRNIWDLIHTWAGVSLVSIAVIHFSIHWGWVVKVTGKMFRSLSIKTMRKTDRPSDLAINS